MNIRNVLFNRKGNVAIWVCALVLIMLAMGSAAWEYSRLNIVAQGSRDAVQAAITQVCTENYNQVYNGVREGYAGGYKLDNLTWVENVDTSNIMSLIDKKIGTQNGVKTTNGMMEYKISDLSVQIKNAPLAPTDTDGVQQFTGSATYTLTVPLSFGWQGLPPMVIPINVTAGYSPKGALSGSGGGSDDIPATGIGLNETSLTLEKGGFASLSATVNPDDATDPAVSWVSSDNGVATVSQAGLVTGVEVGTTTILAVSQGGIAQCNVTVITPVTSIKLNKNNLTLHKGNNETLTVTIIPANASDKSLWWTTSDPNICTIDANGKVTGISPGTAEIAVESTASGAMDHCMVTVDSVVTGISLNKTALSLEKNLSETLIATISPDDASNKGVLWASSNPSICMVDQTGYVTAVDGGSAIVTAATTDGQYVAECTVTVIVHVTGVTLNKTDLTLMHGDSESLTATVWPMNATDKEISWSSLNPLIASVDQSGRVTGNTAGVTLIYATTHDGGFTAQCTITVKSDTYMVAAIATHGTVTGSGTYDKGSTVTLTAVPDLHYHFVNWTDSTGKVIGTNATYVISNLSANTTVNANFSIDMFTATVNAGTGGTATGGGYYSYESSITIKATANSGYQFTKWSDGNTSDTRSVIVTNNISLSATFAPIGIQLGSKAVGSTVKISVNGSLRDFIIVNQGLPSSTYDSSCDGTWLLQESIYEDQVWDKKVNDYANSSINKYLNSTYLGMFSSGMQQAIKQIKIPYRPGDGTSKTVSSGSRGYSTKIFLLSGQEVGLSSNYMPVEGNLLSYFITGQSLDAELLRRTNSYTKNADNPDDANWWLRSPYTFKGASPGFAMEAYQGILSCHAGNNTNGVRPAFILPSTTLVASDGTIIIN